MPPISRRSAIQLAGLGVAALATPAVLTGGALAAGPVALRPAEDGAEFKRFKLGQFEFTILSDGHRRVPNPQQVFGLDQSKAAVEALLAQNLLPTQAMQFSFAPLLINTGQDLVLIDTGNGEGARGSGAGRMLASLKLSGYTPDQVSVVALTHMHGDHIGGIMEGGAPAFPNARYVAGKTEYDFWTDDKLMGTKAEKNHLMVKKYLVPLAAKFTLIGDGDGVVDGITGMNAFGHTPGHMIFRIESGGRTLIVTGDTSNHFVLSLQRPEWKVVFDWDAAQAIATRKKVFDMIAAQKLPFLGYHMPFPSVGFVEKRGEGYHFIPETYQFAI